MTFFGDVGKISRFFLREILNDLFWSGTNKWTRVPAKYQVPELRSGPFRLVYTPDYMYTSGCDWWR